MRKVPKKVRELQYACWKAGVDYPHSAVLTTVPTCQYLNREAAKVAARAQSYVLRAATGDIK